MKRFSVLIILMSLILIYALSLMVRVSICKSQELQTGKLPFTMEGAFLFHFSNLIAQGYSIPKRDHQAQFPEGFNASEKLSLTPDYILGFTYRSLFKNVSYEYFLRMAQPVILCLGIFIIFACVYTLNRNPWGGIWSALLYGLSMNSIVRSTGVEYSRENFALPLLFLHFILQLKKPRRSILVLSSLVLALGCTIWDGSQIYFIAWILFRILQMTAKSFQIVPTSSDPHKEWDHFNTIGLNAHLLVLIPLSFIHPYLRTHAFIFSPGMIGLYLLRLASLVSWDWRKIILGIGFPASLLLCYFSPFGKIYHHMLELVFYKAKYLNIKPLDPSLLPFDIRILWTPALHAAPWPNLTTLLPLIILGIPAAIWYLVRKKWNVFFLLYLCFLFLILFLAFSRLEVFLVFFLSCLIGSVPFGLNQRRIKFIWQFFIFFALLFGAEEITEDFKRFERPVLYSQLNSVSLWVKENTPETSVILANFGLSPTFLAYSRRGIVLQPKYESPDIREKVEDFAVRLFEKSEKPFYEFCLKNGVNYYVHALGTYQDKTPYSWRYMANELEPVGSTLAEQFEFNLALRSFNLVFDNGKYLIYKVILPEEIRKAQKIKRKAGRFFEEKQWEQAEKQYLKSLNLNPNDSSVYFALAKLYNRTGQSRKALQATKVGLKKTQKMP